MPRITDAQRQANRETVLTAARRCFSRNGFHQTSMPDIAAEAGMSTGAPYRYIAGKHELVAEIAHLAFMSLFGPVIELATETASTAGIGDIVGYAVTALPASDADGHPASEELLRCAVDAWGEALRDEDLRAHALEAFNRVSSAIEIALERGQDVGTVSADLDVASGARIVVALVHGFIVQRTLFGLTDVDQFVRDVRGALGAPHRA
ncbi:TetR/AcrR family transcriptional regulator [Tsukamurella sp. 8F]|uniref:TetR/AcrR family transcriptional regulator n=1 Tax=unclassified Tsukamurella TaxID=2633480 RepID=UPI0023B9DE97|nr:MULTISPECIES: TetR/AcrR family transcriptional regulator [unclassified Tsukamurella]MDF0530189.1 TetR/AcrR family transcriptional regulator [Tsukamurella sp. 8J]MDF0586506.1 TetR/AcrR family transcriptional regulator [Tsukamurella sp. 8F]